MEFINKELLNKEKIEELHEKFNGGLPYKHVFIENFLIEEKTKEILNELKKEKFEYKESDLFSFLQTMDFVNFREGVLKEFYEFFRSEEFKDLIEKISGIKLEGVIDMSGSLYNSCDYLLCHDDRLEGRKIAFAYYLSKDFGEEDGGAFVMFDSIDGKVGRIVRKILPVWNSLLIFEVSKKSFHEVEEVLSDKKRYSIGGWLH